MSEQDNHAGATADEFGVLAAQVAGAHGVTGNVRLRPLGAAEGASASLRAGQIVRVALTPEDSGRRLTLNSLRRGHVKGAWIGHFKEIRDRTEAEALIGASLYIKETERPALPEGEYYVDQLLGLTMETDTGQPLGRLTDVLHSPANDVYVSDTGVMVPAVAEFILNVNLEAGRITVRDVPGLRDGT